MAGKLLFSIRFLSPSPPPARLFPVKLYSVRAPLGRLNIFPCIYPFELKCGFCPEEPGHRRVQDGSFGVRRFSARKTVIEDEAELSDWVSEINTKPLNPVDSVRGTAKGRSSETSRGSDSGPRRHENGGFGGSSRRGDRREMGRHAEFLRQKNNVLGGFSRSGSGGGASRNRRNARGSSAVKGRFSSDLDEDDNEDDGSDSDLESFGSEAVFQRKRGNNREMSRETHSRFPRQKGSDFGARGRRVSDGVRQTGKQGGNFREMGRETNSHFPSQKGSDFGARGRWVGDGVRQTGKQGGNFREMGRGNSHFPSQKGSDFVARESWEGGGGRLTGKFRPLRNSKGNMRGSISEGRFANDSDYEEDDDGSDLEPFGKQSAWNRKSGGNGREMFRGRDSLSMKKDNDFGGRNSGEFKPPRNSEVNVQGLATKGRFNADLDVDDGDDDDLEDEDGDEFEDDDDDDDPDDHDNDDGLHAVDEVEDDDKTEENETLLSDEGGYGELKNASFSPILRNQTNAKASSFEGSESYLSESRFDQCSISPLTLKAIKKAGFEKMTVVQEATLPIILKGKDVLGKARTGTGKTLAYLLPSIELAAKSPPFDGNLRYPPIIALIICPTRELACQAAKEADLLLKYHSSIGVQVVIGGVSLSSEQKRMQSKPCQILAATPGRLKDHIDNTLGFGTRLKGLKVLVLDEADQLLDMGFRKHIEAIISNVPKQRQTLLFSATVPTEVREICYVALKKDYKFIDTVPEGSEETHSKVKQMHLVAPLTNQFPLLYALLKDHVADDADYKVLVFCTTAMVTSLVAQLLRALNLNVLEIHSRKTQMYRTKVSDEFRKSTGLILVTSDVSARGVDYPDVTLVVQVGAPSNRQQYIHRLGRTGRKGKEGQGILLLAPWEEYFLFNLKDLPLTKAPLPLVDPNMTDKVMSVLSGLEMRTKSSAYQAWLGYYNSNKIVGSNKPKLVAIANEFSKSMGLTTPPPIKRVILNKMGLKNVPGLIAG